MGLLQKFDQDAQLNSLDIEHHMDKHYLRD